MAITYATGGRTLTYIYTTTGGGTVFSANRVGVATFDYFSDTAVVNDAIYFGINRYTFSKVNLTVGTAMAGTGITITWEFYQRDLSAYGGSVAGWYRIPSYQDNTAGFTALGANSFVFGIPWGWAGAVVNGSAASLWIRARISALTTITEGGANNTTAVSSNDANVTVSGTTEIAPETIQNVYTYLVGVAPWLGISQHDTYYDLREVALAFTTPVNADNSTIETGFLGTTTSLNGPMNITGLRMGTLIGTDFGINGGTFIMDSFGNTAGYHTVGEAKFYGSKLASRFGWGYATWTGTCVFCDIEGMRPSPDPTGTMRNCHIKLSETPVSYSWYGDFTGSSVVIPNDASMTYGALALAYSTGYDVQDMDYAFTVTTAPTKGSILYFLNSTPTSATIWNFINTKRLLPRREDAVTFPRMFTRASASLGTWGKAWFYDASAGTYADITTAINNATVDDVAVGGDVGDIIYMGNASTWYGMYNYVVSTWGVNDYVYAWEYYTAAGWQTFEYVWDGSTNLGQTGYLYFSRDPASTALASLTINGYAGYWHRLRIVTKGTGSPVITSLRPSTTESGVGKWQAYEKYTLDLTVLDESGPLAGATVTTTCGSYYSATDTTDAFGQIVQQELVYTHWYFDPIDSALEYGGIAEDTYSTYHLKIEAPGHRTYETDIFPNTPLVLSITLPYAPVAGQGQL